jgi:hypothetical protein
MSCSALFSGGWGEFCGGRGLPIPINIPAQMTPAIAMHTTTSTRRVSGDFSDCIPDTGNFHPDDIVNHFSWLKGHIKTTKLEETGRKNSRAAW